MNINDITIHFDDPPIHVSAEIDGKLTLEVNTGRKHTIQLGIDELIELNSIARLQWGDRYEG